MIVKWPGVVSPGTRCDKYLMIEDFYPTILEMAGVQNYRTVQPLDGTSFMPLLKGTGDPSKGRAIVWNFPNIWGNNGPGINLNCSIRKDEWKLVYYYETGKKELFNIPEDIGEKHDVAAQHPDIVKRLSKELGTYLRNVGGQRLALKPQTNPVHGRTKCKELIKNSIRVGIISFQKKTGREIIRLFAYIQISIISLP